MISRENLQPSCREAKRKKVCVCVGGCTKGGRGEREGEREEEKGEGGEENGYIYYNNYIEAQNNVHSRHA